MKFYLCYTYCHAKNEESIKKMLTKHNAEYVIRKDLSSIDDTFDVAICFNEFFPPECFPDHCKVLYGPHFFIFPDDKTHPIHAHHYDVERFFFNTLADWVSVLYRSFAPHLGMSFIPCPFGLDFDTIEQVPILDKRTNVLVYVKDRTEQDVAHVINFLKENGESYSIIRYGHYKDHDFKQQLKSAKYVLWAGRHESQGFALQETLASNVPILLWDVRSMYEAFTSDNTFYFERYRSTGVPMLATAAPCWSDDACGVRFYNICDLPAKYKDMNAKLSTFNPRPFMESKLSLTATYNNLIQNLRLKGASHPLA